MLSVSRLQFLRAAWCLFVWLQAVVLDAQHRSPHDLPSATPDETRNGAASDREDVPAEEEELSAEQQFVRRIDRGRSLYRAQRCDACHAPLFDNDPLAAPALDQLSGMLHRDWLIQWLSSSPSADPPAGRHRPWMAISPLQATNLADYLLSGSDGSAARPGSEPPETAASEETLAAGESLFVTVGCLACHRWKELGASDGFSGGDLTRIAQKRPAAFFQIWLRTPDRLNRDHRMPIFDLTEDERSQLAAFLASQGQDEPVVGSAPLRESDEASSREAGRKWFEQFQCGTCHRGPDGVLAPHLLESRRPLSSQTRWQEGCLSPQSHQENSPQFNIPDEDCLALRAYVEARQRDDKRLGELPEPLMLRERNCLACHARGDSPGFEWQLPAILQSHPSFAESADSLQPPTLETVGAKWLPRELEAIIHYPSKHRRRPWLSVRMPEYRWQDGQLRELAGALRQADRSFLEQQLESVTESRHSSEERLLAGARLVTSDGFGCVSCHPIGSIQPSQPESGKRGPNLSGIGQRLDPRWFSSFVRDPVQVSRRMEMPSIRVPVQGVLDADLNEQLAALWYVLSDAQFEPPQPNPVRVLRQVEDVRTGTSPPNTSARAMVLTDLVRSKRQSWIKPIVVGFHHRHHLLYDFEKARLEGWYLGDIAYQRTEGKRWFWELGGQTVWENDGEAAPELMVYRSGVPYMPVRRGQFLTEPDRILHTPEGGVEVWYRLFFEPNRPRVSESDGTAERMMLSVVQRWTPLVTNRSQGFIRHLEVENVPADCELRWHVAHEPAWEMANGDNVRVLADRSLSNVELRSSSPDGPHWDPSGAIVWAARAERHGCRGELRYTTSLKADRYVSPTVASEEHEVIRVTGVPGFEGRRLPLPADEMPTALAWRTRSGEPSRLFMTSLKGRVVSAIDSDADRLEDLQTVYSDELATPYGIVASRGHVDVITKTSLLRLFDRDGDERVDLVETLASGWGHTDDYHDWAVGLPIDSSGRYYVGLPCQQDQRSAAAAYLRGRILQLVPREPTGDNPHHFALNDYARGQRFPMGLALNRSGQLFATDNQGNYNPFNELNHIVEQRHYGFINQLERDRKEDTADVTPPSIAIPHPWTRSVNGICFLESPIGSQVASDRPFGPFTGHLVGCEYDTRRLVRMTVEEVNGELQGAVYPMSRESVRNQEGPKDEVNSVEGLQASLLGPICCAVSPDGSLYVGGLRDSGWGGANNIGEIVRLEFRLDCLPAGIAQVATRQGVLEVTFTQPVDVQLATQTDRYSIESFYRIATPAYGGEDQGRRVERVREARLSADARTVSLSLESLEAGRVYELRLQSLVEAGRDFFPAEAFYTMRSVPK